MFTGELNGKLNNEFMTTRMNIINAVNKMDFKSQQFKDAFEKNPVGIKITEYLQLLFMDKYETLWRSQIQAISEEQFAQLHQILEIENEQQGSPSLCQDMYKVLLDIIILRSMRFMNEWHKQYKIDVVCDGLRSKFKLKQLWLASDRLNKRMNLKINELCLIKKMSLYYFLLIPQLELYFTQ